MRPAIEPAEIEFSRDHIAGVLNKWTKEGRKPAEINNGSCFEFADDVASRRPERFMSVGIGDFMLYRGKWADEEYGFDEALLFHQWPAYQPLHGFTWEQMFTWGVFNWHGIHAWAHCRITGYCFDAETLEGRLNPFELQYFAKHWEAMLRLREEGVELTNGVVTIRRLPEEIAEKHAEYSGWKQL